MGRWTLAYITLRRPFKGRETLGMVYDFILIGGDGPSMLELGYPFSLQLLLGLKQSLLSELITSVTTLPRMTVLKTLVGYTMSGN